MSALTASFPRFRRVPPRAAATGVAAGVAVLVLGLIAGRLSVSHYGKTVIEAAGAVAFALAVYGLVVRRPALAVAAIVAGLTFVPVYYAPVKQHLILHPALVLSLLVALSLALVTYVNRRIRVSAVDACVGLIVVGMGLDILFGPRSWKEVADQLWLWLPPFFAGRAIAARRPLNRLFAQAVVVGAVLLTPFAIAEALHLGSPFFSSAGALDPTASTWDQSHVRPGETFRVQTAWGHPIAYSMFVAVAIVFAVVLYGTSTDRRRRLYLLALPLLAVSEALTLSRTGMVVVAVALVIIAAGRARHGASRAARRVITLGATGLVCVALFVPSVAALPLSIVGLGSTNGATNVELANSTSYRAGLYSVALHEHVASWFGNATSKFTNAVNTDSSSVDSAYLDLLDSYGVVVTLPFVALVIALGVSSLGTRAADDDDGWGRHFRASATALAVGLFSVALITQQEYFVWLVFGLAAVPRAATPLVGIRDVNGRWRFSERGAAPRASDRMLAQRFVTTLRRVWWLPLAGALITGGAAVVVPRLSGQRYRATASLLFQTPDFGQLLFGPVAATSSDPTRAATTNLSLLTLPVLATRTAGAVGHGVTVARVRQDVQVSQSGLSDVYSIQATDRSPALATAIAGTYAREFQALAAAAQRANLRPGVAVLERRYADMTAAQRASATGRQLDANLGGLSVLTALERGGVEPVGEPQATAVSPINKKAAIYGAIPGLLAGLLLVGVLGRRDRRLVDAPGLEDGFGSPVLVTIPDADAFSRLRSTLRYFNAGGGLKTLVVTSPTVGDGKSTVALELAFAEAASPQRRVILVEANLRRPSLARRLGLPPSAPGLAELISGHSTREDSVVTVHAAGSPTQAAYARAIDVLPVTATPPNATEMVESKAMREVLASLAEEYDIVIVDTPAMLASSDAQALAGATGGVIVVARLGEVRQHDARSLRDGLDAVGAPVLGVVANAERNRARRGRLRRRHTASSGA